MRKNKGYVVGIMSGTSLDACDFVLCQYQFKDTKHSPLSIQFIEQIQKPLPKKIQQQTQLAAMGTTAFLPSEWGRLHNEWGQYYAQTLKKIQAQKKWKFDAIGLHGQTVYHQAQVLTMQLGEPGYCAYQFEVPVVGQFRTTDVVSGYQGAPLAPLFHQNLSALAEDKQVCFHNLGGVSNLTSLVNQKIVTAFDTGPGNMPIDWVIQTWSRGQKSFDKEGHLANRGQVQPEILKQLKKHPYFKKAPPKSCGREQFGASYLAPIIPVELRIQDAAATVTEWVAWSVAQAYLNWLPRLPQVIYFCGGGAYNQFLLQRIQSYLPQVQVSTTEALGWPVFAIEGAAFAYLGMARLFEQRHHLKTITGQPRPLLLGSVCEV
jgi:anhydro-N-acetylmuramic acid kinase